jgi:hypothetical protein
MSDSFKTLARGLKFPYDESDEWWDDDGKNPSAPIDWAHAAARGVIADLQDRRGIKQGFQEVDEEVRQEIVKSLSDIIRLAYEYD